MSRPELEWRSSRRSARLRSWLAMTSSTSRSRARCGRSPLLCLALRTPHLLPLSRSRRLHHLLRTEMSRLFARVQLRLSRCASSCAPGTLRRCPRGVAAARRLMAAAASFRLPVLASGPARLECAASFAAPSACEKPCDTQRS